MRVRSVVPVLLCISAVFMASCSPKQPPSPGDEAKVAQAFEERKAKIAAKQATVRPVLISAVDGVRLYRTLDVERGATVYFTTRGDVQYDQRIGKTNSTIIVPGPAD